MILSWCHVILLVIVLGAVTTLCRGFEAFCIGVWSHVYHWIHSPWEPCSTVPASAVSRTDRVHQRRRNTVGRRFVGDAEAGVEEEQFPRSVTLSLLPVH